MGVDGVTHGWGTVVLGVPTKNFTVPFAQQI